MGRPRAASNGSDRWVFLAVFAGALLLRLPFRPQFLVNWDAVNFALAIRAFDIQHHQPHPPGYIGYVAIGRVINTLLGDPNASLTLLSVMAGALAPAFLYLLASQFMSRRYAVATAVLFALSPVVWYYSQVALTYSVEAAIALAILWTAYRARASSSVRYLMAATVLLAFLGSVRQSGAVFLFPLWLYVVWAFSWRDRRIAVGVLVASTLVWLVPLLWLSGGPLRYLQESASIADSVVAPISILTLNPWGLLRNIAFIAAGFIVGINVGLIAIGVAYARGLHPLRRLLKSDRRFFLFWAIPALLTYLLVHTGQLGYVLLVLPIGFLWMGKALASLFEGRSAEGEGGDKTDRPVRALTDPRGLRWAPRMLLAGLALVNVTAFFLLPKATYALAGWDGASIMRKLAISASEDTSASATARARQYDLRRNDAHWQELLGFIRTFSSGDTAVLAVPDGAGSYRHLGYYLPDRYRLYGLGRDQHGDFGHLFSGAFGPGDFALESLQEARQVLTLPGDVQQLIIPDPGIYERIDPSLPRYEIKLSSGGSVVVVLIEPGTTLVFDNNEHYGPWIWKLSRDTL